MALEKESRTTWFSPKRSNGAAVGTSTFHRRWPWVQPVMEASSPKRASLSSSDNTVVRTIGGMAKITTAHTAGAVPRPRNRTSGTR